MFKSDEDTAGELRERTIETDVEGTVEKVRCAESRMRLGKGVGQIRSGR